MRVTVQVRIEPDDANASVIDVATIERGELAVDSLGLCIADAKTLLAGVQDAIVTAQPPKRSMHASGATRAGVGTKMRARW